MNLNKLINKGKWMFYKTISIPSFLVGYGLRTYWWLKRNETINQSQVQSYHTRYSQCDLQQIIKLPTSIPRITPIIARLT
jgi:hypothetical protein